MACRMQRNNPIQLNVTLPETGCDLKIYYHPTAGQQRSILSCDYDKGEQTYECVKPEQGVTWKRTDLKHAIITLPGSIGPSSGYFRYQMSCDSNTKENACLWSPTDQETTAHSMLTDAVSSSTATHQETTAHSMLTDAVSSSTATRTDYTIQQALNPLGSQAIIGFVVGGFFIQLVFLMIFTIATILLYKRNKDMQGELKEIKQQQNIFSEEHKSRVELEMETEKKRIEEMVCKLESLLRAGKERLRHRTPESNPKIGTKAENQSPKPNSAWNSAAGYLPSKFTRSDSTAQDSMIKKNKGGDKISVEEDSFLLIEGDTTYRQEFEYLLSIDKYWQNSH